MKSCDTTTGNQWTTGNTNLILHSTDVNLLALDRRQFEYTCGIFTIALDVWVDGTGERCSIGTGRTTFFIMSARNVSIWNLLNGGLQAYVM